MHQTPDDLWSEFDKISQSTADIWLFPVSENGRLPYWNSTSGFDFDLIFIIGVLFCICLPNFVIIGRSTAQLWPHIDFSRWQSAIYFRVLVQWLQCTRWWKSIYIPEFDKIFQSIAAIKLLPVSEKGQPPYWNSTSSFDFHLRVVISISFFICLPNFVLIVRSTVELWCHVDFSRFRPQIGNLLPGFSEGRNLLAYQISTR